MKARENVQRGFLGDVTTLLTKSRGTVVANDFYVLFSKLLVMFYEISVCCVCHVSIMVHTFPDA